jgi:hypothetical protein
MSALSKVLLTSSCIASVSAFCLALVAFQRIDRFAVNGQGASKSDERVGRHEATALAARVGAFAVQQAQTTPFELTIAEDRLRSLEGRLSDVERALTDRTATAGVPAAPSRATIGQGALSMTLDRGAPAAERARALGTLRSVGNLSTDVVRAMIELFQDPGVPGPVRAQIIRQLNGVKDTALMPPLLTTLASASDLDMRMESLSALSPFLADATVRAAVERVRDNDPDARIQQEAHNLLAVGTR